MTTARRKLPAGSLAIGYPSKRDEAILNAGGTRCESAKYTFSTDGGAAGDIAFGRNLPEGAIIKAVTVDVISAATGATDATLKFGSTTFTTATDLTSAGISLATLTDTDGVKVSAESELKLTIATPASAGEVRFFVEYLLPND